MNVTRLHKGGEHRAPTPLSCASRTSINFSFYSSMAYFQLMRFASFSLLQLDDKVQLFWKEARKRYIIFL